MPGALSFFSGFFFVGWVGWLFFSCLLCFVFFFGVFFFLFWCGFIFMSCMIYILQIMAYASTLLAELLGQKGFVTKGLSGDL